MLASVCIRAFRQVFIRSQFKRMAKVYYLPRTLFLGNTDHISVLPRCAQFSTAPHAGIRLQERPSVERVLQRFSSRRRDWHLRPTDGLLSALDGTDSADRAKHCVPILNAFRSVAAGRAVSPEHLEQIWRLATEGAEMAPSAEAVTQCLRLCTDSGLPPPAALAALAARCADSEPELAGRLVQCLCAAGRLEEAAPLLDRLRADGRPVPQRALHEIIVAHAHRGELDTARDMAQALLPAAAGDDSDHQLLMMRVYVAARRPGPLAGLLQRWYQQRGPLSLGHSLALIEALATSGQLDQLQQVIPLVPWSRYGPLAGGCVRLQRLLVRLGQHRTALALISAALDRGGAEGDLVRLARGLITEMAVTEQPVSAVAEVCSALSLGPLLPSAWFSAAEVQYRLGRWRPALQLLLRAQRAGLKLRQHLFWPALLHQARAGDGQGVRNTLSEMVSAGVVPGLETLRDYALPAYVCPSDGLRAPAELVVQRLKEAGLTAAAAAEALVCRLLTDSRWDQAAAVCERYSGSVSVPVLVPALLQALHSPAGPPPPVDACVRLLRCAFQQRAAHEDPVGAVLLELAAGRAGQPTGLLAPLLQAAGPAGLRLSPVAAELACERLSAASLAPLQASLLRLADPAVSSRQWESLEAGAALPQDASLDELEDHLVELTKKGGNTRGVLRKLILMHCRKHNLERALELEAELCGVSDSGRDGEPLTSGLLAALLALHVHHGRLEAALGYRRRLERRPDGDGFLDQFKRIDLATLLVRRGHTDDAVSLLERLEPESDPARLSMACWRLLAAAADWGDPPLAGRLLQLLQHRAVLEPTAHHWGQLVRAHIVSGDLSGAAARFCRCARDHRTAAHAHGLLVELARRQGGQGRRRLLEDVLAELTALLGPESAQYQLALALSEAGRVTEARRVMQTVGRAAHFTEGRLKRHCGRLSRAGQVEALVRLLQTLPHREARPAVYWALLNAYERSGDLRSVEEVLTQLETGELGGAGRVAAHARALADRLRAARRAETGAE